MTGAMRIRLFSLLLFFCMAFRMQGQPAASPGGSNPADEDRRIFERYISSFQAKKELPVGELVSETALFFLGAPYVASTLEREPEQLTVNLREFDCTTFVETVLALSRTLREPEPTFENFCHQLQSIRYRGGVIRDYTDRLHYFSDWAYENERKGWVKEITQAAGGKPLALSLSFMSTHPGSYRQLKDNPAFLRKIAEKEKEINGRPHYYLPAGEIQSHLPEMQSGDIVCFVTTILGLDVSHVGFVYRQGVTATFIHASSAAKKVIVQEGALPSYVRSVKRYKGIILVRPVK